MCIACVQDVKADKHGTAVIDRTGLECLRCISLLMKLKRHYTLIEQSKVFDVKVPLNMIICWPGTKVVK